MSMQKVKTSPEVKVTKVNIKFAPIWAFLDKPSAEASYHGHVWSASSPAQPLNKAKEPTALCKHDLETEGLTRDRLSAAELLNFDWFNWLLSLLKPPAKAHLH